MNTTRLYLEDPYMKKFKAKLLSQIKSDRGYEAVLDQTAFYPTGGGQPCDTGWLENIRVIDVVEEDGNIIHILEGPLTSGNITGRIDWERRFDHMQQHSGQHILSSCFEKIADANTVGFHLGSQYVYIDLDKQDLSEDIINQAEDMANQIIFQNRPIKTHLVDGEKLAGIPLRKPPAVTENIRIVEIEGFDYCPCGGTHPSSTGNIGIIKIRRWEKSKDNLRLEFLCGSRALMDYRQKNYNINKISSLLSVRDFETPDAVERILDENKKLSKTIEIFKDQVCTLEAENMVREAPKFDEFRVIQFMFYRRPFDEVKLIASKITGHKGCIAILCTVNDKSQVIISRSGDVPLDMRQPFKEAMTLVGGKGGGNCSVVQGGIETPEKAQRVMDMVYSSILENIEALQ
jgi:alanyl-tRNA synthetase